MTFDLKAARQICDEMLVAYEKEYYATHDACARGAGEMLPAALDEIERLQKQSMHDCISCRSEAYREGQESQAKRIAELEADKAFWQKRSQTLREVCNAAELQSNKQRAALKILGVRAGKRGKALVEERAKIVFHNQMMPLMGINNWGTVPDDDFEIKVGNCMLPVKGKKYRMSEARKQLEAEYEAMR